MSFFVCSKGLLLRPIQHWQYALFLGGRGRNRAAEEVPWRRREPAQEGLERGLRRQGGGRRWSGLEPQVGEAEEGRAGQRVRDAGHGRPLHVRGHRRRRGQGGQAGHEVGRRRQQGLPEAGGSVDLIISKFKL